jgi:choline kinase
MMTAVILAAGIGSRLRPLTDTTPKCLLSVGGVPLLERSLNSLHAAGLRDALIVTGYRREDVERFARSLDLPVTVRFLHNPLFDRTGNNYSLWLAMEEVAGREMVMLDADILFQQTILTSLLAVPGDALVLHAHQELGGEEVKVQCDPGGFVVRIGKDIEPRHAAGESLGIEKFCAKTTRILLRSLAGRKHLNEFYEASFQEIINQGVRISAVSTGSSPCMEIDTLEDLRAADTLARSMN